MMVRIPSAALVHLGLPHPWNSRQAGSWEPMADRDRRPLAFLNPPSSDNVEKAGMAVFPECDLHRVASSNRLVLRLGKCNCKLVHPGPLPYS